MCKVSCLCFAVAASRRVVVAVSRGATRHRDACRLSKRVVSFNHGSVSCGYLDLLSSHLYNSDFGRRQA